MIKGFGVLARSWQRIPAELRDRLHRHADELALRLLPRRLAVALFALHGDAILYGMVVHATPTGELWLGTATGSGHRHTHVLDCQFQSTGHRVYWGADRIPWQELDTHNVTEADDLG